MPTSHLIDVRPIGAINNAGDVALVAADHLTDLSMRVFARLGKPANATYVLRGQLGKAVAFAAGCLASLKVMLIKPFGINNFEAVRVHAGAVATSVDHKSLLGDRPNEEQVCRTVDLHLFAANVPCGVAVVMK